MVLLICYLMSCWVKIHFLIISMDFNHWSLNCEMPVISTNVKACNSFAEWPKLHTLDFKPHACARVLFYQEWKHCTKQAFLFLLHSSKCSQCIHIHLLMTKEGLEEKKARFAPPSPSSVSSFVLIDGPRKEFMLLRRHWLCSACGEGSDSHESVASQGCQHPAYSVKVTFLLNWLRVLLNSYERWIHWNSVLVGYFYMQTKPPGAVNRHVVLAPTLMHKLITP